MKNKLLLMGETIYRVLEIRDNQILLIDCIKRTMPKWAGLPLPAPYECCEEKYLREKTKLLYEASEPIEQWQLQEMNNRFSYVQEILPYVSEESRRSEIIALISKEKEISKQTVRKYLCLYLSYLDIQSLCPMKTEKVNELSEDEKNMRWALNKYFYNTQKNPLRVAYTLLLKERYSDSEGILYKEYPSFYQFRYFYRKTRNLQNYYISREGVKKYQRDYRPLLGDSVQAYAPTIGTGMVDSTVCDIYLVNDAGQLIGTICVDAFSSLCLGYSLTWEGGTYSLRDLTLNMISDKQELCKCHEIEIKNDDWNASFLPIRIISDRGSEYVGDTFGQIVDLGISIVNLPAYRPKLKGTVEQAFDVIQEQYKPYLKRKGVIEADYQERGAHDYRKDACLTLEQFERIIIRCILYYNNDRIIENYPYSEEMLSDNIRPYARDIWDWALKRSTDGLVEVEKKKLIQILLPRVTAKFTRKGLIVNRLRYSNGDYKERYLNGGDVTVAYNPDDVSTVWLLEDGNYIPFELIESRYNDKSLQEVNNLKSLQGSIVKKEEENSIQAKVSLASFIQTIAEQNVTTGSTSIKGIRDNRRKEQSIKHKDFAQEAGLYD